MSGTAVVSIPADAIEWGEVQPHPAGCSQMATVLIDGRPAAYVTVTWPTCPPALPVACAFMPRQAGQTD